MKQMTIKIMKGILVRTKAAEFICYMPLSQFNRNYRRISRNSDAVIYKNAHIIMKRKFPGENTFYTQAVVHKKLCLGACNQAL